MYFYFKRFMNEHLVELNQINTFESKFIDPTSVVFYLKRFVINHKYIPEGTILHNYEESKYALETSNELYLVQIFGSNSMGLLKCRTVDIPMRNEAINVDELNWVVNLTKVQKEVANKLIGEYIMCVKKQNKYLLLAQQSDLWLKTNASDLVWNKEGTSKIEAIQEGLVWVNLLKDKKIYTYFPLFLSMNMLTSDTSQLSLVGKEVAVYKISNNYYFKLKSQKTADSKQLSIEKFSNDFNCEVEPKIEYRNLNISDRIKCINFPHVFGKPQFNMNESFMSQPEMNKNLATVIAIGIFEHLIRFKSDLHFKSLIEGVFTKANVDHIYRDLTILFSSKSVKNFYNNIGDQATNIKRIGEGVLSLLENDVETFEGLQELCDITGCCIHLRNFTEGFKQIKIVPTHYKIKRRPIINLGKYFSDYFLIYSSEVMNADKYFKTKDKPKRNFPYYDENFEKEEMLFKEFLKTLMDQVGKIRDYLDKKLSGVRPDNIKHDFENEAKLYGDYFYEKYNNKTGGIVANELKNLSFSNVFYKITGKKYFCNCGCVQYFDEASNPKKVCVCKRDYSKQHLVGIIGSTPCFCRTMDVQSILNLP